MWRGRKPVNPNHFCLTFSGSEFQKLMRRLKASGVEVVRRSKHNFGAQGYAASIYVHDPDGIVVEARYYPARVRRRRTRG